MNCSKNFMRLKLHLTVFYQDFRVRAVDFQRDVIYQDSCVFQQLSGAFPVPAHSRLFYCIVLMPPCGFSSDVNFIASPPSMVAAGSVVAAVQGLYLKSQDTSLSSQNLTNFLSQVIRSDPVCHKTFKHTCIYTHVMYQQIHMVTINSDHASVHFVQFFHFSIPA